ncbi:acyl-coenzyme A synthetase/AMP-(fatty) acid ligase [Nocardia transvalensis]|uniref:Acyl-coenzyme A synthetase/AMP-(Fatty) acid ligase n=1 Tax=Nocardia transvalensis TaxID=37333 RepID=A0A7W9P9U2_9NOCA|nr:class I adenylate-forming enzyme family protein [Nocardia transvalensis]MBB5912159.1 acyl-coenzyme A synthetase/AMP-(fatty) acid ligase [Nocardia transvalensis]
MTRNHKLIYDQLVEIAPNSRPWISDHPAEAVRVVDDRVTLTDIADAATRAATLFEDAGVRPGDYCAVWLDAPLDIMVVIAGLTAVGGVPVLISPGIDAETLGRMLEPVTIERIVTTDDRRDKCEQIATLRRVDDWAELAAQLADTAPRRTTAVSMPGTAPYIVTHTSGTTGVPKLVQYTRNATDHQGYAQEVFAILGRLRGYAAVAVSPVHFRTVSGLLCALRRNVPLIVLSDHSAESVGEYVRRYRPIYLETHPNTFMQWEHLADNGTLASVRHYVSTFDVIHPGTVRRLLAGSGYRLASFLEAYGQSELGGISAKVHLKGLTGRFGRRRGRVPTGHRAGWTAPGYSEARIVGPDGTPVPAGTAGRIQVRSAGQFQTYINRREAAEANLDADGWWDTGDWGRRTRLGELVLIDRQVERLTTVPSAVAMEDLLLTRMPWLLEAIVLEQDRRAVPVVALRDGPFRDTAWRSAVSDLPQLAPPVVLDFRDFPRTVTGKIQRSKLSQVISQQGR